MFSIRKPTLRFVFVLCGAASLPLANAQDNSGETSAADEAAAKQAFMENVVPWQKGPGTGAMGGMAEIKIPAGYWFVGSSGTQKMMKLFDNTVSGNELGMIGPAGIDWFVVFEFDAIGYVKDDDRDDLDADKLMKTMKAGQEEANKQREQQGMGTMELLGWIREPYYDPETKNLNWAIRLRADGHEVVNHRTKLLGRRGVMEAVLVADPQDLDAVMPKFEELIAQYSFTDGHRHAQFEEGDKIAEYGLAALVAGGAAAVALKFGILQKFWKVIVVGVVAVAAFFKKILGSVFGRREVRES